METKTTGTPRRSLFSAPSLSVLRLRRRSAPPVNRLCTPWRGWWPTTLFSTIPASAASTATPNLAWARTRPCRVSSTASHTSSSCSRAKATTTRASAASSTRSCGLPRRLRTSPRHRNIPQPLATPPPLCPLPPHTPSHNDPPLFVLPLQDVHTHAHSKHRSVPSGEMFWRNATISEVH